VSRALQNFKDWRLHTDDHPHNFDFYLCYKCWRAFQNEEGLEGHWMANHDRGKSGPPSMWLGPKWNMWFWCGFCEHVRARWHDYRETRLEDYQTHVKEHFEGTFQKSMGFKYTVDNWWFLDAPEYVFLP
jgi:hypothetical protein